MEVIFIVNFSFLVGRNDLLIPLLLSISLGKSLCESVSSAFLICQAKFSNHLFDS